ncbi:CBS domain-containing protein [Streptomyces sp. 6N223]|uniref:CBS domain-containing protein n=1 Tax=Streptomyces sp. 6N223 TaxID=3457412 RepID=UPI003FD059EE
MAQTVAELMSRDLVTVHEDDTVSTAAKLMRQNDTGDVAVLDDGHLIGIVTDRDITVRVVAEDLPATTQVGDVASESDIVTVTPRATLDEATSLMREHAIRRLPVLEEGELVGMLSIGDIAIEQDPRSGLADISAAEPNK